MNRMKIERIKKRISKKSKKGFQGYPVLTIAYYGPDAKLATKVAVGFIKSEDDDVIMERYYSDADVRTEESIQEKTIDRKSSKRKRAIYPC